jgi:plasmid maintenance system antidote protein VapI
MTGEDLKDVMQDWDLNAAQLAKVLCLHSNKLSEYLADAARIPCAVAFSIEAVQLLTPGQRSALIQKRLQRKAHQG